MSNRKGDSIGGGLNSMPTKSSSQTEKTNFSLPEFLSDVHEAASMDAILRDPRLAKHLKNATGFIKNLTHQSSSIRNNAETSSPFSTSSLNPCISGDECTIEEIVSEKFYVHSDDITGQKRKSSSHLIDKLFSTTPLIDAQYGDVEELLNDSDDNEFPDELPAFVKSRLNSANCECEYCRGFDSIDPTSAIDNLPMNCDDVNNFRIPLGFDYDPMLMPEIKLVDATTSLNTMRPLDLSQRFSSSRINQSNSNNVPGSSSTDRNDIVLVSENVANNTNSSNVSTTVNSSTAPSSLKSVILKSGEMIIEQMQKGDYDEVLLVSAASGHLEMLRLMLTSRKCKIDKPGSKDLNALMEASTGGHIECVKELIQHGANVNARTKQGNTALMYACAMGYLEIVAELINSGAEIDAQNVNGHTALMEAASAGHCDVAEYLVNKGCNMFVNSLEYKETALTLAAYKGHYAMVDYLIRVGPPAAEREEEMHTALMEASMDGHVDVARLLINSGAQVNMPPESYESPLTLAACGGHVELGWLLIQRGANLEEMNDEGYTALMEAAREGHEEMVSLLVQSGAKVNVIGEENRESALFMAASAGYSEVVEMLLKVGADTELGNSTPLIEASQEGHSDIVKLLLSAGANVNAVNINKQTPLLVAADSGHNDVVQILIERGALVDKIGEAGMTPLMKAASNGHEKVVETLLKAKANVNLISENMTALGYACMKGHESVVDFLLSKGADPLLPIKDSQGFDSNLLIETSKTGSVNIIKKLMDRPLQAEISNSQVSKNPSPKEQKILSSSDRTRAGEQLIYNVFCNFYKNFIVKQSEHFKNSNPPISNGNDNNEEQTLDELFEHVIPGLWLEKHLQLEQSKGVRCQHFDSVDRSCQTDLADLMPDCDQNNSKPSQNDGQIIRDHLNIDFDDGTFGNNLNPIQYIYGIKNRRLQRIGYLDDYHFEIFALLSECFERKRNKEIIVSKLLELMKSENQKFNDVLLKPINNFWSKKFHNIFCDEMIASVFRIKQLEDNRPETESSVEIAEAFEIEDEQIISAEQIDYSDSTEGNNVDSTPKISPDSNKSNKDAYDNRTSPIKSVLSDPNFQPFQSVTRKHEARNSFMQKVQIGLKPDDPLSNSDNWAKAFPVSLPKSTISEKKIELTKASNPKYRLSSNNFRAGVVAAAKGAKLTLDNRNKLDPRLNRERRPKTVTPNEININKMVTLNSTNSNNETPLTVAAAGGNLEMVKFLLSRGADYEHREKKGLTPLMLAAREGHVEVLQHLIESGASIEASSERTKDTALTLASSAGHYDAVSMLLNKGANKEHRNVSDYTSLALAAAGGHREVINLLLSYGAEINSRTGSKLGISPLMLAAMNGHADVLKLLLDRGGDINAYIETNRNTALTLACFQGRNDCVELLLDRGANIEHRAKTGLTPLMEAASGGFADVGHTLIKHGADINAPPVPASKDTALTIAADKGHSEFVGILLEFGAFSDVKNKKGYSPLWLACNSGHKAVVKILVDAKCDPDSQDNRKVSCIMAACRKGHLEIVQYLLQHVTQLPSDQDIKRSVELCPEELREKVEKCSQALLIAKKSQEEQAAKHAASLLELIDQERSREEKRKAAAARKKKKKEERKKAKKQENKTGEDKSESSESDKNNLQNNDKDKDNSSLPSAENSFKPDEEDEDDDETSGITGNDEEFEHFDEILVNDFDNQNFISQDYESNSSDKKKNKNKNKTVKTSSNKSSKVVVELVKEKPVSHSPNSTPKTASPPPESETVVKRSNKKINNESLKPKAVSSKTSKYQKTSPVPPVNSSSNKENGKRDEGWREVTQVNRRGKRVNVPSSAISRVIGRAGCNINTVRELSGAHIEVEKQAPGQTDRWVLIRGSPESSKYASQLINSLANNSDTELSQHIFELGLDSIPILTSNDGFNPSQNALICIEKIFGSKSCENVWKSFKNLSDSPLTGGVGSSSNISSSRTHHISSGTRHNSSNIRSHSSNANVRLNKSSSSPSSSSGSKRNISATILKETSPNETKIISPAQGMKHNERISPEMSNNVFTSIMNDNIENGTSVWCKSPVNNSLMSTKNIPKTSVEVSVDDLKSSNHPVRAYVSPSSYSTTSTSSLASANTLPLNISTNPLIQNNNFTQLGNVRSAPCTPPISNLSNRICNKFENNPRIIASPSSTFESSTLSRPFQELDNTKADFQSMGNVYGVANEQDKQSSILYGPNRVVDSSFNDNEPNSFRNRHYLPQAPAPPQGHLLDFFRNTNPVQGSPQALPNQTPKISSTFNDMSRRNISSFTNPNFPVNNGFVQRGNAFDNSSFILNQSQNINNIPSNDLSSNGFINNSFNSNNPMRIMSTINFPIVPPNPQPQPPVQPPATIPPRNDPQNRFNSYQRPLETIDRNGQSIGTMFGPNYVAAAASNFETMQEDLQRGKIVPIGAERAKKQSNFVPPPFETVNEVLPKQWDATFQAFPSLSNINQPSNSANLFGFDQNSSDFDPMFSQFQHSHFQAPLMPPPSLRSTWGASSMLDPVDPFVLDPPQMNRINGNSFINSGVDSDYYSSSSSSSVNKPMPNVNTHPATGLNQFGFKNDRTGWNN